MTRSHTRCFLCIGWHETTHCDLVGPLKAGYGCVIITIPQVWNRMGIHDHLLNKWPWLFLCSWALGSRWPGTPHSLEAVTGDFVHLCNLRALIPTSLPSTHLSPLYLVPGWPLTLTLHHVCSWFQDCPLLCVWIFLCHQTRRQGPGTMAPVWPLCTLISLICLPFW